MRTCSGEHTNGLPTKTQPRITIAAITGRLIIGWTMNESNVGDTA